MTYRMLAIRTPDDDDPLYPVLSGPNDPFPFALEDGDGHNINCLSVSSLAVKEGNGNNAPIFSLQSISAELYVTDSRVVVCCEKYDMGRTFGGIGAGAIVAGVATAVSTARAANRRKGKMLAGHVRYPCLALVGGQSRSGLLGVETLRLVVKDGTRSDRPIVLLDCVLRKNFDSVELARRIAARAARYTLAHDNTLPGEHRITFEKLTKATRVESSKNTFGMHAMPYYWFIRDGHSSISNPKRTTESPRNPPPFLQDSRVCPDCGSEYPPSYAGAVCIDCGGSGDLPPSESQRSSGDSAETQSAPASDPTSELHEFEVGAGPVAAHRHPNGGGWVADTATVSATAYVGPLACVFDQASVLGRASIDGTAWVLGNAVVEDEARIRIDAEINGCAHIMGAALVTGRSLVTDAAVVRDSAVVSGCARITENAEVSGSQRVHVEPGPAD